MAFIGNTNTTQAFTPAIDYFSGTGSATAFTLSRPVASVAQVQVTIDNVAQNPSSAYTISGSTITFTSAPLSGTNNIYVYYTSPITQVIAPGQGTVTSDSFGAITNFTTTGNTILGDASTDTLNVGNGGLVKDASGNILVGATTAISKVTVAGGVALSGGAGTGNAFYPYYNSATSYNAISSDSNGGITFVTGVSAPSIRATISNAGYLTTPYHPAFYAIGSAVGPITSGVYQAGIGSGGANVVLNNGSNYNTSTGAFTAPVAGMYVFSIGVTLGGTPPNLAIGLTKNGASQSAGAQLAYYTAYNGNSYSVVVQMALGDTMNGELFWNNGVSGSTYVSLFSGFLMG